MSSRSVAVEADLRPARVSLSSLIKGEDGPCPSSLASDVRAVFLLLGLTLAAGWDLLRGGTIISQDTLTQFYPWYSFLGERLRSADIPAWNPYSFSGAPFAADPLSGWTYLPAMSLFTLLPLATAAGAFMLLHPFLAGLFTYALARALGMRVSAALVAALAYEFSTYFWVRNTCCFAYSSVYTWLPLALLGAELAIRSRTWLSQGLWWGVGGLGLSQILASWLGQGSYYAGLVLGGYIAYRTLVSPPAQVSERDSEAEALKADWNVCPTDRAGVGVPAADRIIDGDRSCPTEMSALHPDARVAARLRGACARASAMVLHGGGVLLFGVALAAAGLLPRVEFNALSNLSGGYPESNAAAVIGGLTVKGWGNVLSWAGVYYAGGIVCLLAGLAPFVARSRLAAPYWTLVTVGGLVLSGQGPTPLHRLLEHLPIFARLHPHGPERVLVVWSLGVALLAGATWNSLPERRGRVLIGALPAAAVLLFALTRGIDLSILTVGAVLFGGGLVTLYALLPTRRPVLTAILLTVLCAELIASDRSLLARYATASGVEREPKVDLASAYEASGAGRYLQWPRGERSRSGEEPFRYLGYLPTVRNGRLPYALRFTEARVTPLEVNNRSIVLGLQDVQGYNPIQVARYEEYMAALNGRGQDYHFAEVFGKGLNSPLLDLLNVRYILTPVEKPSDRADAQGVNGAYPTVYRDEAVRVVENPEALPRAWVVHSARQVAPGEALELLGSGSVDPRDTALLEVAPPPLARPAAGSSLARASVTEYSPDRIRLSASTEGLGLLMLSEVYYPAWKAYVDGRPAPVYRADHTLRAVPLPPGQHEVELRYESATLRAGLVISLISYGLLCVLAVACLRRWRKGRGHMFVGAFN